MVDRDKIQSSVCIISAALTTILTIICMATDYWEIYSFDATCVTSKNTSDSYIVTHSDYYSVTLLSQEAASDETVALIHTLHNRHAGIWNLCNVLTDESQEEIYGDDERCFNYVQRYPEMKSSLSNDAIYIMHMRNSALSSLILNVMMLAAAGSTGIVGIVLSNVVCLIATSVFYALIAFYMSMALLIMATRMRKEEDNCASMVIIPDILCDCHTVREHWSFYVACSAAVMSVVSSAVWFHLMKVKKDAATKLTI